MSTQGDLITISGPPAVGKTTAARLLATRFPLSALLSVDQFRHFVIGGKTRVFEEQGAHQAQLALRNTVAVARCFLENNFTVLIDDVLEQRDEWEYLRRSLAPFARRISLFTLVSLPVLEHRFTERGDDDGKMLLRVRTLSVLFERAENWRGTVVDTGGMPRIEVAELIFADLVSPLGAGR